MAAKLKGNEEFERERLKVRRRLVFDENESTTQKSPPSPLAKHNHMVYEETIGEFVRQKSQKWNFDFESGTPVSGPYEWVEVSKYNLTTVTNRFLAVRVNLPENEDVSSKSKNSLYGTNENVQRKAFYGKMKNRKFKQTILKDFYKTTKRTSFSPAIKSSLITSAPSHHHSLTTSTPSQHHQLSTPSHHHHHHQLNTSMPPHHHQITTPLLCFK